MMDMDRYQIFQLESPNNGRFKTYKRLNSTRGRKRDGKFLVETKKLIADALAGHCQVETLITSEDLFERILIDLRRLLARFQNIDAEEILEKIPWTFLSNRLFKELSGMEESDGLIMVVKNHIFHPLQIGDSLSGRILVLDSLQDPGNVGTLLRSAEAFGISQVIGISSVDFENPKVLRASMGSVFRLKLYTCNLPEFEAWKKKNRRKLIGADLEGTDYRTYAWPKDALIVLGNEGHGLTKSIEAFLDDKVTIPMQGQVESLNVAISGSLLMSAMNQG